MARGSGKNIGLVLSGCGFMDGSEIHEATLTMLALDKEEAKVVALSLNEPQSDVVDHLLRKTVPGTRNMKTESARIARGKVEDLSKVSVDSLHALIFPGGNGAAKNLSSYAKLAEKMEVQPAVAQLVRQMHQARKPMGFICIAPVIAAKVLGEHRPRLTIGNDAGTAADIEALGAEHVECRVEEIAVDEKNRLVSTPAYMLGPSIAPVNAGIERLVAKIFELIG